MSQEELYAQYENMAKSLEEQRNSYLQQLLSQNQAAQDAADADFDEIARQAYIAKRQNENALPQQLAALGLSGGGSETANLELAAAYQNSLNSNEQERQKMLKEYALQALNARQQANSDISGYYANAKQGAATAWQTEQANRNAYNQWAANMASQQQQFAAEYDLSQKQLAAQQLQQQYENYMQQLQWQNTLQQQEYQKEWTEKQWQNTLAQQEYEKALQAQQVQNTRLQQQAKLALQAGDYDTLAEMGYSTTYLKQLRQAELQKLALEAQKLRRQI